MSKRRYTRPFVGIKADGSRESFRDAGTPDAQSHPYVACIGPFRTRRAADYMAKHGRNNPHLRTVTDAERSAAIAASQHELAQCRLRDLDWR